MMKRTIFKILAAGLLTASIIPAAHAQDAPKSGYVDANGLSYYYEVSGTGEPLLFLHGGLMNIDLYAPALQELSKDRQVIAVNLQGHGRTALGSREISLVDQGADMATVIKGIGFDQVDVIGHSMGGGVAFQFAAQNPAMVGRLVLISTPFGQDGFYPEMLPMQAEVGAEMLPMMKQTPMYQSYAAVAPNPDEFPMLLDQMGAFMRKTYDWSADVAKLTMPTMLVYGDSDMFKPEHEIRFYQLLGGGLKDAGWQREHMSKNRLAVIPDATHYDIFGSPLLLPTIVGFLDGGSAGQ